MKARLPKFAHIAVLCAFLLPPVIGARAQTFSVLTTVPDGPAIGAIRHGTLYGTTLYGGNGNGTVFSISPANEYSLLHSFDGTDGSAPNAMLGLDKAGEIVGTASNGGADESGTLWKVTSDSTFTLLHSFGADTDGAHPLQGPVVDKTGTVFGTTAMGAIDTNGNVFRATTKGRYKTLYDFLSGTDGHCPFSGLARDASGTLYGTTVGLGFGGNPLGSVWKLEGGVLTTLYAFQDGTDGEWPMQAPVLDSSGNLYGTTEYQNGALFAGAIWKIDTKGHFSVLHDFNQAKDGGEPNSPLIVDTDGKLYGTTYTGGTGGYGTVYQVTPSGHLTVEHAFTSGADGATPTGNLVHDGTGAIYGGTQSNQVFKIVP